MFISEEEATATSRMEKKERRVVRCGVPHHPIIIRVDEIFCGVELGA
jgi:hypothetical protein